MPSETRYPLHMTLDQLTELKGRLDVAAAAEGDPDAPIFAVLDQVRAVRKQALAEIQAQAACAHDYNEPH